MGPELKLPDKVADIEKPLYNENNHMLIAKLSFFIVFSQLIPQKCPKCSLLIEDSGSMASPIIP